MSISLSRQVNALMLSVLAAAACSVGTPSPGAAAQISNTAPSIGHTPIPYIFDIVADPSASGTVLLATQAGVYRARQDGTAERISGRPNPIWSLSRDLQDMARLYARGLADDGAAAGLLVSNDHGRTWQGLARPSLKTVYLHVVEASKVSLGLVYGANYALWHSPDGGLTWASIAPLPGRVLDLAASAIDAARIFAATMSGLHVSDDGGLSWKVVSAVKCWQPVTAVDTGTDGTVYAFSLCAGLVRGDERTESWSIVHDRFGGCIIQHLAVDPQDSARLYAVLRCHKVLVSEDGGVTWREFGSTKRWEPNCPTSRAEWIELDS